MQGSGKGNMAPIENQHEQESQSKVISVAPRADHLSETDAKREKAILSISKNIMKEWGQQAGKPTAESVRQAKKIKQLIVQLDRHDEYCRHIDCRSLQVVWQHGVEQWLGYNLDSNLDTYVSMVHPFIRMWYLTYICAMYELMSELKGKVSTSQKISFILNLPIRKASGSYVYIKQTNQPIEFDEVGTMVSYLSISTIVDAYRGHPLHPRFFIDGVRHRDLEARLIQLAASHLAIADRHKIIFPEEARLTPTELRLLLKAFEVRYLPETERAHDMQQITGTGDRNMGRHRGNLNKKMRLLLRLDPKSLETYKKLAVVGSTSTHDANNTFRCLPLLHNTFDIAWFLGKSRLLEVLEYFHKTYGYA
jgi:hypothetical protein